MVWGINLSKNNKYPIQKKVFLYFVGFTLLIFLFLWLFQIFFLKYYYESAKEKDLIKSVNDAKILYQKDSTTLFETLEDYAFDKGICTEVVIDGTVNYTTNPLNRGCLSFYGKSTNFKDLEKKFIESDNEKYIIHINNPINNAKILIYGLKLDNDTVIFSNTSIDPIDSTVDILKSQLIIITAITIIVSSIMAYFIANNLSKPITNLTKKSKELSKGNFNVDFDVNSSIIEIDDLAKSLNYTRDVLKTNDDIRRDLMANVSHDLKTPLTMIKAYAEMVRDLSYNNEEKRTNDLNVIVDEVDRLNGLVNDILALSKLESNIEILNKEEFDLVKMIKVIIQRFKIFSITQDYEIIYRAPKELIVYADKQKIEQVIYNLISNAINYSEYSKKIYITILEHKDIRVNISDTGPGIKEEDIHNIWDKYYKADKNHKRNTVGTGLGLSIVKNIFELHKYKYGVISKKNKGTTFYFEIKKNK